MNPNHYPGHPNQSLPPMHGPQNTYPQPGFSQSPYPPQSVSPIMGQPSAYGGTPYGGQPAPYGGAPSPYPPTSAPYPGGPSPGMPYGVMPQTYPTTAPGYGAGPQPYGVPGVGTGTLRIQLGAHGLLDRDKGRDKSDPYFVITKDVHGPMAMNIPPIHRSEVIYDNLDPLWQPFTTSVQHFCNGDYHQRIKITIYDMDNVGSDQLLGECFTTLRELMDAAPSGRRFPLNCKKMGRRKAGGDLYVRECSLWKEQLPT